MTTTMEMSDAEPEFRQVKIKVKVRQIKARHLAKVIFSKKPIWPTTNRGDFDRPATETHRKFFFMI